MHVFPIPLLAGILPLLAIHLCYWWAASLGHVPWCNPYIDSCTSISAAGREAPEFYLFKGLMIPAAVMIAAYWWLSFHWLITLGSAARKSRATMLTIGLIACGGLILYSVVLGGIGDVYRLQRRIGVILFFGLTYLAQLLLTYGLIHAPAVYQRLKRFIQSLQLISAIILGFGVMSVILGAYDEDYYDTLEDAFEWCVTLLLCIHVLITGVMWKLTDYRLQFRVQ